MGARSSDIIQEPAVGQRRHDADVDQYKIWNGREWEIDYRALLKRYMSGVAAAEGIYFIEPGWSENLKPFTRQYPEPTDADEAVLGRLASEISDYCAGDLDE